MNSRTSRPRSPTSASTEISASVPRAIIDSSVDFPDAGPGEDAHALAAAARHQGVDHADAEGHLRVDQGAAQRVRRCPSGRHPGLAARLGPPSMGSAQGVERPAPQGVADGYREAPGRRCTRRRRGPRRSSPSGMHTRPSSAMATTSATSSPFGRARVTASPMAACDAFDRHAQAHDGTDAAAGTRASGGLGRVEPFAQGGRRAHSATSGRRPVGIWPMGTGLIDVGARHHRGSWQKASRARRSASATRASTVVPRH